MNSVGWRLAPFRSASEAAVVHRTRHPFQRDREMKSATHIVWTGDWGSAPGWEYMVQSSRNRHEGATLYETLVRPAGSSVGMEYVGEMVTSRRKAQSAAEAHYAGHCTALPSKRTPL